jgi:hypothetical protein
VSTPILDPSLPAYNAPIFSGELRGQFQAISNTFDDIRGRLIAVMPLSLTVSNPPTQAEAAGYPLSKASACLRAASVWPPNMRASSVTRAFESSRVISEMVRPALTCLVAT